MDESYTRQKKITALALRAPSRLDKFILHSGIASRFTLAGEAGGPMTYIV
jgi:hypothetical protein